MRRLGIIGACMLAMLAAAAVVTATASANAPEYGHCVAKAKHEGSGFTDRLCTKAGTGKNAKFEWEPGPGPQPGIAWEARFSFSHKYDECRNGLQEEEVARKLRENAASAAEPEKGELIREAERSEQNAKEDFEAAEPGKVGGLSKAECEKVTEEETAKSPAVLETTPVPAGKGKHSRPELRVACGEVNASGDFSGDKTSEITVVLSECASTAGQCSSGAGEGEISLTLDGELGFVEKNKKVKAAISLAGVAGEPFASFTCGTDTALVSGSAITEVTGDHALVVEGIDFGESQGAQSFQSFIGGPLDVLETSLDGGEAKTTGLRLKVQQKAQEAIEIDTSDAIDPPAAD